jgi:V8-like Glu-specific endopeptidase
LHSEPFFGDEQEAEGAEAGLGEGQSLAATDTGVIGSDDREPQSNTVEEPNRWVCLLDVASDVWDLKYGAGRVERARSGFSRGLGGTGLLISPRHILTAAHVVQQVSDRSSQPESLFVGSSAEVAPGYNGAFGIAAGKSFRKPYGSVESGQLQTPSGYMTFGTRSVTTNSFDDFGLVQLAQPIHALSPKQTRRFFLNGKWHEEERTLPALGYWGSTARFQIKAVTPADLEGAHVQTIGYPSKQPDVSTRPRKKWMQWLAKGRVDSTLSNTANHPFLLFHTADTTDSQSGSPIWTVSGTGDQATFSLVGIVTAVGRRCNVAVALTERVLAQVQRWAPDTFEFTGGALKVKGSRPMLGG